MRFNFTFFVKYGILYTVKEGDIMDLEQLYNYVSNELSNHKDTNIQYPIKGVLYDIRIIHALKKENINIPFLIAIPKDNISTVQIALESNNLETSDLNSITKQACQTGKRLANLTRNSPCPIVIPFIPSYKNGPYFQQLSRECFELDEGDKDYRVDEQIIRMINYTKNVLKSDYNIQADEKIFLNGYSSSGVFAQRFALIHPELVETACIGGASGSIPVPSKEIGYPLGISDYQQLFGKPFDKETYSKINFRYYVGELETINKTQERFDDEGNPAPMHDMSFFDRSVPYQVGLQQRDIFGKDMFERAQNTIEYLESIGIKINHTIIPGRSHNNVNELGDKFFSATYKEAVGKHLMKKAVRKPSMEDEIR